MKKKLEWYPNGEGNLPISILGNNEKLMLITLAILQGDGGYSKQLKRENKVFIDPEDRDHLKLTLRNENK